MFSVTWIYIGLLLFAVAALVYLVLQQRKIIVSREIVIKGLLENLDRVREDALADASRLLKVKEKEFRQDAIKRSTQVQKGKLAEILAPLNVGEFGYDPRDCRFLGSPIDYVIFDGLSSGEELSVVFMEVKSGQSRLNARERRVREAIEKKEVHFEVYQVLPN